MNDQDRFFHEVDRQEAELAEVNSELQILAEASRDEVISEQFREYMQAVFGALYQEIDVGCEWDQELISSLEAGWDLHK